MSVSDGYISVDLPGHDRIAFREVALPISAWQRNIYKIVHYNIVVFAIDA